MKKVIFFDFFGVISSEVAVRYFNNKFDKEFAAKIKDEIFVPADRGDITEEETYELVSKATGDTLENVRNEWYRLAEINKDMVNFILELKKDHKVYLLSNAISSYLNNILKINDLNKCFDEKFISGDLHLIKPNSDYFEYACNKLNLEPQDCIMIDDNPKNIEGARAIGINGIVYVGLEDLKNRIKNFEND